MKVAAVQLNSGADVAANLAQADELVGAAAADGAQLIVLPENFAFMGAAQTDRLKVAEQPGTGPIQDFLAGRAARHGVWLVGGTIAVFGDEKKRAAAACLVYGPDGELAGRYDKIHLFDVAIPDAPEEYRESASTVPGNMPVVVDTGVARVALAVCYDIRFPALFHRLGLAGMDVLSVPAAFTVAAASQAAVQGSGKGYPVSCLLYPSGRSRFRML